MIDDLWYKNAIIYCLDVETFIDANGDGVRGLRRADAPARLPGRARRRRASGWRRSSRRPNRDNGYDIADYYGVDPRYGTLGDFVEFIHQAEQPRHPRHRRPGRQPHLRPAPLVPERAPRTRNRRYRDWYVWSKKRPPDWNSGMVFPGVQKATWTRDPRRRRVLLPPLLRLPARPEHGQPRRAARRSGGSWASGSSSASPASASTRCRSSSRRRRTEGQPQQRTSSYLHEMRDFLQWRARRRDPAGRGERRCRDEDLQLLRRRRRPDAHDAQLLRQPAPVLRAGHRRRRGRSRQALRATRAAARRPRSGRTSCATTTSWTSAGSSRRAARSGSSTRSPRAGHAALRPRHPPAARADARQRPPPAGAGLQPAVHPARHAGAPLRRRDRHGRRPVAARARTRPHADAVDGRPERRLLDAPRSPCGRSIDGRPSTATRRSTSRRSGAIPTRCCNWIERMIRLRKECPEIGWGDVGGRRRRGRRRCSRSSTAGRGTRC